MSERIERAAISHEGEVWSVPRPGRHHDVIRAIFEGTGRAVPAGSPQGFITSTGRFVGRVEASLIAWNARQLNYAELRRRKARVPPDKLYSEDMW